jgi:hypothetical protein
MHNALISKEIMRKWDEVNSATVASLRKNGHLGEEKLSTIFPFLGVDWRNFGSILAKLDPNTSEIGVAISAKLSRNFACFPPRFLDSFCDISFFSEMTI